MADTSTKVSPYRGLTFFWRTHLAVALGAAVATAVLTGALLVGDSVRGSLRQLTLERLGEVDHALAGQRFWNAESAGLLDADPAFQESFERAVPAILLQGTVEHAQSRTRATQVSLQGVDESFTALFPAEVDALTPLFSGEGRAFAPPTVINQGLANELGAALGDTLLFQLKRWSDVPRSSLLGRKDTGSVVQTLRLTVAGIVPDRGLGHFGLALNQALPLNVFVALPALQRALRQEDEINAILVSGNGEGETPAAVANQLDEHLRATLELGDLGLILTKGDGFLNVESEEFVLKPTLEPLLAEAAEDDGARALPLLTYLINRFELGDKSVPYSTVGALDSPEDDAFGELVLVDGSPAPKLARDEILLNTWTAEQLGAEPGDTVTLHYFVVGPREELREDSSDFRVAGIVEMTGLAADPTLSQEYPGIADSENMSDWDPPFPIDLDAVRPIDEEYWDDHRGTPKAFVALETGQELWQTRWGRLTGLRLAPGSGGPSLDALSDGVSRKLLESASLDAHGLAFQPVKSLGLRASGGATDFGGMFIGFSMFLIASAAMLAALLFSLGVEQRAGELGLRLAVGEPPGRVRRRFLIEGGFLAAAGGVLGLAGAVGYASLMMLGLRTWWLPAVGTSRLELFVSPLSLIGGYVGSVLVVLLAIWLTLRRLRRLSAPQLLARVVEPVERRPGRGARWTATIALGLAAALLIFAVATGRVNDPALFFAIGPALLVGALALFALLIGGVGRRQRPLRAGAGALLRMAAMNGGRNRRRSLLATTLVACACFLIVVVGSYYTSHAGETGKESGTGGYALVAEAAIPLYQDLESSEGRFELGLSDEAAELVASSEIVPFRLLPGEDTSCLNLYQPGEPRVLGVPAEQIERGGFRFAKTLREVENPWTLLNEELEEGVIPALGDANSTQWILKLGLGEDLTLEDEYGEPVRLRLVGTMATSVFQSELLISEEHFKRHFPSRGGFSYFLIEPPEGRTAEVTQALESGLDDYGFDAVTTLEKLRSYHAVQNTYLATFQTIGGLGLLLGTVGLAVVLARNVLERRKELATLRAFGFRRAVLTRLITLENGLLLFWGLVIGSIAALLTTAPHILEELANIPWSGLGWTLLAILVFGLVACWIAASRALRTSLLPALKADR